MAAVKFAHLPIGQHFTYQGEVFFKSAPLTATSENGAQRMIPRSAVVEPLTEAGGATPDTPAGGPGTQVLQAVDTYHAACLRAVSEALPEEAARKVRADLDRAKKHLLAAIAAEN